MIHIIYMLIRYSGDAILIQVVYIFHIHLLGGVYEKYTTCAQNRDQRIYIYIYVDNAYLHVRVGSLTLAQLQLVICKVAETG